MKMGVSSAFTQYAQTPVQYMKREKRGSLGRKRGQYLRLKMI